MKNLPELRELGPSKAEQIRSAFSPMYDMLVALEAEYDRVIAMAENGIDKEVIKEASKVRKQIARVRIDTGKKKDEQKKYIKLEDRAIMAVHNTLVYAVQEREDNLKKIEKHHELMEQQRIAELQAKREVDLMPYVDSTEGMALGAMEEDVWALFLRGKMQDHEDKLKAEEQARIEREEREMAKDNLIRRQAIMAPLHEFIDQEAVNYSEAEFKEAVETAKEKKDVAEYLAKKRAEEVAKIEEQQRKDQAAKAKADQERQALLQKGDKAIVLKMVEDIVAVKPEGDVKSEKMRKLVSDIASLQSKIKAYANSKLS